MLNWDMDFRKIKYCQKEVQVIASSNKTIAEEMLDAYKDVVEVVEATEEAKLANKVAKLSPALVLKS